MIPSAVGYTLYFYLHHRVGPGQSNLVAYINPVAALSIGTLLFGEPFEWWELAGFALILVGLTLLTQFGQARRDHLKPGSTPKRPRSDPAVDRPPDRSRG